MTYMKTILVCVFAILGSFSLAAQSSIDIEEVRKATDELTAKYGLSREQVQQVLVIQERRLRNLAEIEPLKNTDEALYRQKLKNIRMGAEASLERILTPEQRPVLERERVERRKQNAAKLRQMELDGVPKEDILKAMEEMESEY